MFTSTSGVLEEAYQRFHTTGPDFDGGLSNHGPMAVEAMVRRGHEREVHAWIDWYQDRLDEVPRGLAPVTAETWREALGDRTRVGDWTTFMLREVQLRPWRELLVEWWPRLLPGIIAGSTHGVIRVGHSVRTLLSQQDTAEGPALEEFAHALAYWAARWRPLEVATPPRSGAVEASAALAEVPSVAEQGVSISHRLSQLAGTPGWSSAFDGLRAPESPQQAADLLADLTEAAVRDYLTHGQANPVMLVHASTAPTAVLRTLPALPSELWIPSLDAAWLATAAVTAAYRNTEAPAEDVAAARAQTGDAEETFERAVRHKDEHAVKFADAALDVHERAGSGDALAAATRATLMIKQG
jgi:Questin oxidase-like